MFSLSRTVSRGITIILQPDWPEEVSIFWRRPLRHNGTHGKQKGCLEVSPGDLKEIWRATICSAKVWNLQKGNFCGQGGLSPALSCIWRDHQISKRISKLIPLGFPRTTFASSPSSWKGNGGMPACLHSESPTLSHTLLHLHSAEVRPWARTMGWLSGYSSCNSGWQLVQAVLHDFIHLSVCSTNPCSVTSFLWTRSCSESGGSHPAEHQFAFSGTLAMLKHYNLFAYM